MNIYQTILLHAILPLGGIGFIIIAIIWRKSLGVRPVIDLNAVKLGVVLKADAFGLIVLLGLIMIGAGVYFMLRDYDSEIASYRDEIAQKENTIATLRELKMTLKLDFPQDDPANPNTAKVEAYVEKATAEVGEPVRYYDFRQISGGGGISLVFYELGIGDELYVVVKDEGREWQSKYMRIPVSHLMMTRIQD